MKKNPYFSCANQIFAIFATVKPRENGMARESAFFALFLEGELAQFTKSRNIGLKVAFTVMIVYPYTFIQWSTPLSFILLFMGVQAQPSEIRISLGGSALFVIE